MAFFPPEEEYQNRVNDAFMKHTATGLRAELKDDGIPNDASDEDVIRFYRDTYAADASPEDFNRFLDDTYSHDFKAPEQTLPEKVGGVARGLAASGPSMARQFGEQIAGSTAAGLAKKSVYKVGAPLVGGVYLARLLAQVHAGNELADIAENMPAPDITALQKHYFESLEPSLTAKGYTPEQVATEVQRRVRNVVRGYTATQSSLMGDVQETSQNIMTSAAEGISNVALLGAGSGFFKNALLSGARAAAGRQAAKAAAKTLTSTVAGRLVTHGVTGAGIGSAAVATTRGIESGAEAAQAGKPVFPAVAGGAIQGAVQGALGGAVIGGTLGVAFDAIGSKAMVDAAIQTPEPPMAPEEGLKLTGVAPTAPEGTPQLTEPMPVERLTPEVPSEPNPQLIGELGPTFKPPGVEQRPAGTVEPVELPRPLSKPEPDAELTAARASGTELNSIALPTEPVERITKSVQFAGGKIEGANVAVRPSVDGRRLVIDSLKGAEHGSGTSGKALDRIVASADEQGVPIDVTVGDYKGPRGGTIPAERIAQWYERRGFVRVNETEGSISLHRATPDPNPPLTSEQIGALAEHHLGEVQSTEEAAQLEAFMKRAEGLSEPRAFEALGNIEEGKPMIRGAGQSGQPSVGMRLGNFLDQQAAAAEERIRTKLGRLNVGFDPTLIGDYAIKAAAKMYRLGLTAMKAVKAELMKDHPDIPDTAMKEIVAQAREIINSRLKGDSVSVTTLTKLLQAAEEGRPGADWYDKTAGAVSKMFGQDSDMMLRFLAATSAGKAADANVTLALKAYGQWKLGLPFDGFIGNDKGLLEKAARGEVFGERKLQSILGALRGDENSVAIDRHVMRALGFAKAGAEKGSLTDREYDFFEAVLQDLARTRGMSPRQFQAALWTSAKIRQAQSATTPREMSHLHTFRPYEGIMKFEHSLGDGGMTPVQWLDENRVTLQTLANASEGVTKTRGGSGFTYDPHTFGPYKADKGLVTTLASVKIPTNKLSAAEVMSFANKWKRLIAEYPGLNVGTFNLDQAGETGMTSMDLNIVLPEEMRELALSLGRERGQHSLWDLAKEEVVETGFKGKTAGAPDDPKLRGQWWRQQQQEIDGIMERLGVPSRKAQQANLFSEPDLRNGQLQEMMQKPHEWASVAKEMLGVDDKELRRLVDEGQFKPVSDAGLLDTVEVHKDGTVWEYTDPTGPSYNVMKLVGSLRGSKAAQTLVYLEGKNILTGHDVVQNYRAQAGFARLGDDTPALKTFARKAPVGQINASLVTNGGSYVKPERYRAEKPMAVSLWISPDGKAIHVPVHVRSAASTIKKLRLKNPFRYEGPEHSELQTLLNHGYVRVQMHEQSYAADSSVPLTGPQVMVLRELRRGPEGQRQFAGRLSNPNGEHRSYFDDFSGSGALNKFIAESRGE